MQKPSNSTIINVCVVPKDTVSAACVSISQSLKSEDTLFVLGDGRFAHMTAFMARFAEEHTQRVVSGVSQALQTIAPFVCEHTGYFMTEGRYLELSYRKSASFMQLHEALIGTLSSLRLDPGNPYEESYFTPYTPEQQRNAKDTGYDLARNLYRPHITLTRYAEGGVPVIFPAIPAAELSFSLSKICVYKADDNGAVYECIKEFQIT